jgi:hypothetical protein
MGMVGKGRRLRERVTSVKGDKRRRVTERPCKG